MKFQGSQNLPPHQDRRLQLRMLGFVALIGLVMFAVQAWRIGNGKGGSSHPHYPLAIDESAASDDSSPQPQLKDDEVRMSADEDLADLESLDDPDELDSRVDIPKTWLANVRDNTLGIRRQEAEGYFRILSRVAAVPPRDIEAKADHEAIYVNLMASPDQFRGRLISISGEVVALYEYAAGENRYGITRLYDAWILTPDSGNQPYRVVCQSIPPELKPGKQLHQPVRVAGYFFKKEAYQAQGKQVHVAPTLLASQLLQTAPHYVSPPVEGVVPWLVGIVTVIGLAMLATVVGFALSDSRTRRWSAVSEVSDADAAAFSRIDHRLSIAESLRRLENDEPLETETVPRESRNGHPASVELPDELIDLPTPFPPTRVPRPPQNRLDES